MAKRLIKHRDNFTLSLKDGERLLYNTVVNILLEQWIPVTTHALPRLLASQ
jgi:hypothetical protein